MSEQDHDIYEVATILLECARDRLADTDGGVPNKMRVSVVPGEIAWDECECPGLLAVSVENIFPSNTFPTPETDVSRFGACGPPYIAVSFVIAVARCSPVNDGGGANPPTTDQLDEAARIAYEDMLAVYRGVMCCAIAHRREFETVITSSTVVGPAGMCVGSELRLTVGLRDTCTCED